VQSEWWNAAQVARNEDRFRQPIDDPENALERSHAELPGLMLVSVVRWFCTKKGLLYRKAGDRPGEGPARASHRRGRSRARRNGT